jgi:hypothetical protein
MVMFPASTLNLWYTVINVIEAVTGAMLLRKFLPWYNPLQNLNDWIRLAIGSALIPPLLGVSLPDSPHRQPRAHLYALVPLGGHWRSGAGAGWYSFKPHYLLRHRKRNCFSKRWQPWP